MLKTRRRTQLELHWAARPYRTETEYLGTKRRWVERSHTYEVVRFSEGLGDYLVYRGNDRIGVKKSLSGAKQLANRDARERGPIV